MSEDPRHPNDSNRITVARSVAVVEEATELVLAKMRAYGLSAEQRRHVYEVAAEYVRLVHEYDKARLWPN